MRIHALAVVLAVLAFPAQAEFPDRPIRFVVPFAPGGGADAFARAVGDGMSQYLNQRVIIGTNSGFSGAPSLHKSVGYDPLKDFTPISMIGMFPLFLVVNRDLPVKNLRELVDYVSAHPNELNYASGNAVGIVCMGQLVAAEKLKMTHVPYKGEAPALPDLLSNRVQMIFTTGFILPYVKDGRVKAIAALLDERNDALPNVPTVAESGFGYLSLRAWAGVFGPAGLPRDIQMKLNAAVNESLKMQSTKDALALQGFPGKGSTPQELSELTRVQLQTYAAGAKAAGIEPE
jgi:tripartite-type tricarboxylate transporter receptor subunit TctC